MGDALEQGDNKPAELDSATRARVDVLIQTFNEEENLPHTLASLQGWVRSIHIVDSGSTDRTISIAREYGASVVHHEWEGYAAQKNTFTIDYCLPAFLYGRQSTVWALSFQPGFRNGYFG